MNRIIVTTTINPPSEALYKFLNRTTGIDPWKLILVGDTKTPHDIYEDLEMKYKNFQYLGPDDQDALYPELSAVIGWKTIQRRNIGFAEAYNQGAQIIATIDDDNIPYEFWGRNLYVSGGAREIDLYDCETQVFDPLSVTNYNNLWHRGFPIQLIEKKNNVRLMGRQQVYVHVQADLWDGDPDIDAFERIAWHPCVKFDTENAYMSPSISPFNSQNTFLTRDCFPHYCCLPFVGRMDDIFGGYLLKTRKRDTTVVYNKASVYQARNAQDLIVNLKKEYIGYEHCLDLVNRWQKNGGDIKDTGGIIPKETTEFYETYQKAFRQ